MKIVEAGYQIITPGTLDEGTRAAILTKIERIGRVCYKSEDKITEGSASAFVKGLVARHHEAMLEHAVMTVLWTVDIAVGREMVRHRIASYAQESTRYCNYSKDRFGNQITVVRPYWLEEGTEDYRDWANACLVAECAYFRQLEHGRTPQEARCVLPLCTKAELVSTMNLREWRHFFQLRAADATGAAHPQMKQVTVPLLKEMRSFLPEVFGDIHPAGDADD